MKHVMHQERLRPSVLRDVERLSGQDPKKCYQCGKCSAGCPLAADMDLPPNQVMRFLQLGFVDMPLRSRTIWLCASCATCTTRCPREVDLAAVMDALRQIALRKQVLVPEIDIPFFNKTFLNIVRRYGRVYEMELIGRFNTMTFNFFKDVTKAPVLFLKGRLKLLPSFAGRKMARAVFRKVGRVASAEPPAEPVPSADHHGKG